MADTSGQYELRSLDIDKLAKGFAEEENVFKNFLTVTPTSSREIRWYQKTVGFITGTTTTGITSSSIANVSALALPDVAEQSWTRLTSYVRKYMIESPWISYEDIRDCDPDILAGNVRDLTRSVANQIDKRIYSVLSGSGALSGVAMAVTSGGWVHAEANPWIDLLSGATTIRGYSYEINNLVALMHPVAYKNLLNYLVSVKGSSIPNFSSEKVENGVLTKVGGIKIVASVNCDTQHVVIINPQRTATWKEFTPITAAQKEEVGIGVKLRVWEEGEIIVTDPYSYYTIKGVGV
jgi:hypothetical protein